MITIGIEEEFKGFYRIYIDINGIKLNTTEHFKELKDAENLEEKLDNALDEYDKELLRNNGVLLKEDLNPEFLKTIEKIK